MTTAIEEARNAYKLGEVPVGAVIVHQVTSQIIAKAHNLVEQNQNAIFHAEILAIQQACNILNTKNLSNCDIYVSLEPCTMCAGAIAFSRLNRLFYGAKDQKQGAIENGVRYFNNANCFYRPEIFSDIQSEVSEKLLKKFFKNIRG